MSSPVIQVENLCKEYEITHQGGVAPYQTLRDSISGWFRTSGSKNRSPSSSSGGDIPQKLEIFKALKNVSFEVNEGEVLGIVGRNGAGKSTLLKILSRITEPSSGRVRLKGRVSSLLEVGTGFHPELTGRENIFLNGAILGMSRSEIREKFDEIVAFSGVEKFLDTPVKRYSSGMYVRLAFAVAAHLEPEILIVDEVLAVGDAEFQQKCLGRMQQVAQTGRTVLFVSHNLPSVERLCTRALLLGGGELVGNDTPHRIVSEYQESFNARAHSQSGGKILQQKKGFSVDSFSLLVNGIPTQSIKAGTPCTFQLDYRLEAPLLPDEKLAVSILLYSPGQKITNLWSPSIHGSLFPAGSKGRIECTLPKWPLRNLPVRVDLHVSNHREHLLEWEECLMLESLDGDYYGTGLCPDAAEGIIYIPGYWAAR